MQLSDCRVLVTGADGFIGSHLAEMLLARAKHVRALVLYNSFNSWGWLDGHGADPSLEVVAGDVRDSHFCRTLVRDIDVIFNLAALIPIPYSYLAPESYIDTNVKGALHLCQAARESGVGRFVQMSSSEVYGTARYVPIDEAHPLTPQSPYSASKIGADAVSMSFYYAFGLPVVVARPFNTYGPRQSARAVIPTIISQIAAGATEVRLGDTTPTRDFTYVTDTCEGLIATAMHDGAPGEVFNIGSDSEISVADLFGLIAGTMNASVSLAQDAERVRPARSEVRRLRCDNRKLVSATGFQTRVTLTEGIRRTVEWFRDPANLAAYRWQAYNV